jgi:2-polyprenyl-6-methoxyphenol hydroxylase-like FAD-dependent oxidoreductase
MSDPDTDVLVVGSGPAGGAMALALATYGVQVQVITKYGRLADTPAPTSPTSGPSRCSATSAWSTCSCSRRHPGS